MHISFFYLFSVSSLTLTPLVEGTNVREPVKGWEGLGNKKKVRDGNWVLYFSPPIPIKVLRALYIHDPGEYHL